MDSKAESKITEDEDNWSEEEEEAEIEEEEEILEEEIKAEDLLIKNTESFKCLAQLTMSRSSLLLDPFYWFPELKNPNLDDALYTDEPEKHYDNVGTEKYLDLCKKLKVQPYRKVINNLESTFLDLSFFGLNTNEIRTICETLETNEFVQILSLQENNLDSEAMKYVDKMLLCNKTIKNLDLKQCRLSLNGAEHIKEGFAFNKRISEMDLSHNDLADEGTVYLAHALSRNKYVRKLNLSHNNIGVEGMTALGDLIKENEAITDLNLSWNNLYRESGFNSFMEGLLDNDALTSLNLSWCGIGDRNSMRPIFLYLRSDMAKLEDLDLSNNRITGIGVKMLKSALKLNQSIINLNLSSNPLSPAEVEFLANTVLEPRDEPYTIESMDFSNIMVDKSMIKIRNRCRKAGVKIKYEGIFNNYKVKPPDIKPILLNRAKFVAMNQKKKKYRQDFGVFLLRLGDEPSGRTEFTEAMDKWKIKLDNSLIEGIITAFSNKEGELQTKAMKEAYLQLYPETVLPPKKPKKKKKKKKPKIPISYGEAMPEQLEQGVHFEPAFEAEKYTEFSYPYEEMPHYDKELAEYERFLAQSDVTDDSNIFKTVLADTDNTLTENTVTTVPDTTVTENTEFSFTLETTEATLME